MASKRAFVCFLIDGQTEIDTLNLPFEEMFDRIGGDDIHVEFRYAMFQGENHGDVTTTIEVNRDNIEKEIHKLYFKQQDKETGWKWSDLTHIVHIIDIDGAYTKDDNIKGFDEEEQMLAENEGSKHGPKKALYFDDHIAVNESAACRNPIQQMQERNKRKRCVIERLLDLEDGMLTAKGKKVKYELYYFSVNLDHFLYGEANLSGAHKKMRAADFQREYNDADKLEDFFKNNEFRCKENYTTSWEKLRKGNVSLARGTNVNILIEKIKNSSIEDWL